MKLENTLLFLFLIVVCLAVMPFSQASDIEIKIHYLGHAAFVIQFDNGIDVLTDYGIPNAYGLGNVIKSIGGLQPDVSTYSHDHLDHRGGTVVAKHVVDGLKTIELDGIKIFPIRTSEANLTSQDNSSFVFEYKNFTIVHLGDAQSNISNIETPEGKRFFQANFPKHIDVLLMTIGKSGLKDITLAQVEATISILNPDVVIPMHYWVPEQKREFLNLLKSHHYNIAEIHVPKYRFIRQNFEPRQVISLEVEDFHK